MFIADRQYLAVDPARSLYSTCAYYVSVLAVNSVVTVANAVVFMLLLYSMMGAKHTAKNAHKACSAMAKLCLVVAA